MPRFRLENKNKGVAVLSLGVPQWIVRVLRGNTVAVMLRSRFAVRSRRAVRVSPERVQYMSRMALSS
jgi:hypothetical protein